jgi:myo-inositol 2-dehydrogenase/D-chiro-inositol 1-dehydrogenase
LPPWRNHRDSGGGVLLEIATHHFDLWRFLLGSEVEEVFTAPSGPASHRAEQECAVVTARMSDGTLASAVFSERTYGNNEVEVFGAKGWLRMNLYQFDGLERASVRDHAGDLRLRARRMWNTLRTLPQGFANRRRGGDFLATYRAEWQQFADAILNDGPVGATLADGRAAAAVSLAAVESAETGRPVSVERRFAHAGV